MSTMALDEKQFTVDQTGDFVAEVSCLQLQRVPKEFMLNGRLFKSTHCDMHGLHVEGWWFAEVGGKAKALIIND